MQVPEQDQNQNELSFGNGSSVSVVGVLSGAAICIAVPYVVLAQGHDLGAGIQTALVIASLVMGGSVSIVSAFFGLVMPRRIPGAWTRAEHWKGWAQRGRQWKEFAREMEDEQAERRPRPRR